MLAISTKLETELFGYIEFIGCCSNGCGKQRDPVCTGPVWQGHWVFLVRRVGDRHDLVESFLLANHAEIGAGAFLRRISSLLQIDHLGIEGSVSGAQGLIECALLRNRCPEVHRFAIAVVRKPQLGLETEPGNTEQ